MAARAQASPFGKWHLLRHSRHLSQRFTIFALRSVWRFCSAVFSRCARDFRWELEAWAIFSNRYHFIAHTQGDSANANSLSQMLGVLHARTTGWINRLDKTSGRKVWHNFWDTRLTFQKSYLARLNYVHQNAVKHGLVLVANQYRWCSARWFEGVAAPALVRSIYRFRTDALTVNDDFAPIVE